MVLRDWLFGESGGSESPDTEPVDTSLSLTQVATILSNERRVHIVDYMSGRDDTPLSELSEEIARREGDDSSQHRKRVYISLYQVHLPRLDEADVLDVSRRTLVSPGPEFESVRRALEALEEALGLDTDAQ